MAGAAAGHGASTGNFARDSPVGAPAMMARRPPFWAWPGWTHIGFAAVLGVLQTLWWVVIYWGADYLTARHNYRVRLNLDWELTVPFLPEALLGYMSIYPLFWAVPFVLRTRREVAALVATEAVLTLVAGICFLAFPAEPSFPPSPDMGMWAAPVTFAKWVARKHNLMPSLHVAMSVVCL